MLYFRFHWQALRGRMPVDRLAEGVSNLERYARADRGRQFEICINHSSYLPPVFS